jgi:hypothetical protein
MHGHLRHLADGSAAVHRRAAGARALGGRRGRPFATKRDLAELETRLVREIGETRERIAAIDARLDRTSTSLDARIEAMDARIDASSAALAMRIAETKTDLLKWTLGALTAQTALLLSAMKLL